ncbi:MAG: ComF family protein [Patescibacteria group bacterium]
MDSFVKNWLFPIQCVGCGKEDQKELLCDECFSKIHLNQTLFCGQCRARLPEAKKICHKDFPYLLGMAADYDDKRMRDLITGLKFKFWREAEKPLGKILTTYTKGLGMNWKDRIFIPIPLSKQRERERGFNQSEMLARTLARVLSGRFDNEGLVRIKNTKPQSEMDFEKRHENIQGVFAVKNPEIFRNQKVVLVDDVVTSGATFHEAASVLKEAGAKNIVALAVAGA